jgi:hypothetical protein
MRDAHGASCDCGHRDGKEPAGHTEDDGAGGHGEYDEQSMQLHDLAEDQWLEDVTLELLDRDDKSPRSNYLVR